MLWSKTVNDHLCILHVSKNNGITLCSKAWHSIVMCATGEPVAWLLPAPILTEQTEYLWHFVAAAVPDVSMQSALARQ